jgi:hypothetical protein
VRILTASSAVFQPFIPSIAFAASFGGANSIATPDGPLAVQVADIDGDDFQDVIVTIQRSGSPSSSLTWYENSCTGTPCTPTWTARAIEADLSAEGGRSQGLSVRDMDLDGDFDVVFSNGGGNDIYWYENDGSGSFTRSTVVQEGVDPYFSIATADINDDDFPDILAHRGGGASGDEVVYFINQCSSTPCDPTWGTETFIDGTATGSNSGSVIDTWQTIMPSDIDGDGFLDVAVAATAANDLL